MYTIKCPYYKKKFNTLRELIDDVLKSGMDPSYMIYKNGRTTHERVIDHIQL